MKKSAVVTISVLAVIVLIVGQFLFILRLDNQIGQQRLELGRQGVVLASLGKSMNGLGAVIDQLEPRLDSQSEALANLRQDTDLRDKELASGLKRQGETLTDLRHDLDSRFDVVANGIADANRELLMSQQEFARVAASTVSIETTVTLARGNALMLATYTTNGVVAFSDSKRSLIASVYHGTFSGVRSLAAKDYPSWDIKGVSRESLKLGDGRVIEADTTWLEEKLDLAIYEIAISNLPAIPLSLRRHQINERVRVFGTARSSKLLFEGRIAGINKQNNVFADINLLSGHSGSGVFSTKGEFLGVVSVGEPGSYAIFVPASRIAPFLERTIGFYR